MNCYKIIAISTNSTTKPFHLLTLYFFFAEMTVIPDDFLELPIEELKRFAAIGKKTVENLRELDFETVSFVSK